MPRRKDIFLDREIYHIYNKTIDDKEIFRTLKMATEFLSRIKYYRSSKADMRYSFFTKLPSTEQTQKTVEIENPIFFDVDIMQYCLMSNHFHLLVKQRTQNGVRKFMSNTINSITRYYNLKSQRKGPVFLTQFQSKHIVSEEYLLTVSRYIHLNPYKAGVVKNWEELIGYKYSSLSEYVTRRNANGTKLTNSSIILRYFSNSKNKYRAYLLNACVQ